MAKARKLGAAFISILLILILSTGSLIAEYINLKASTTMQAESDQERTEDSRRVSLSLIEDLHQHVHAGYSFFAPGRGFHIGLFYLKDDKHLRTFYPTVPTPPPNMA